MAHFLGTREKLNLAFREIDLRSLHVKLPQIALPKLWNCPMMLPRPPARVRIANTPMVPNFGMVLWSFRNGVGNE